MNGLDGSGWWFDELEEGARFSRSLTITEAHLVQGAGLIGDFNPHHTDAVYAGASRFGTRILHGMITSSIMGAAVGMRFYGTALAYLEHNARFTAPVRAGDTLSTVWTVVGRLPKPRQSGGIVVLDGIACNQDGVEVAVAQGKILVASRPQHQAG
jgi:acyl dehydratase